ncbi:hypothetical protein IWZ03DRAFT_408864 [Phyllosticta citriasiana]|uniref:Uncharacterized protein n=1 Tax=Phyllosticta citriasiana TaxID=595635 RepID=A0ABR1KCZ8_9PEZI
MHSWTVKQAQRRQSSFVLHVAESDTTGTWSPLLSMPDFERRLIGKARGRPMSGATRWKDSSTFSRQKVSALGTALDNGAVIIVAAGTVAIRLWSRGLMGQNQGSGWWVGVAPARRGCGSQDKVLCRGLAWTTRLSHSPEAGASGGTSLFGQRPRFPPIASISAEERKKLANDQNNTHQQQNDIVKSKKKSRATRHL